MAHACLQVLGHSVGAEVLHIKGAAVDPSLRRELRGGSDADVLVRPDHLARLLGAMDRAGWRPVTTFETDSDFGAAVTLFHELWGFADVHRFFPGIGSPPAEAFQRLWRDHEVRDLAGIPCTVPSMTAQAVILVLNDARSTASVRSDVAAVWDAASLDSRRAITALVADLAAEIAFAAGTGELERFRGAREYDLWRIESQGGTRIAKWLARVKAAPSTREAVRLAFRAVLVNSDHLAVVLGRPVKRRDIIVEFFARPARGIREECRVLARRVRGIGGPT